MNENNENVVDILIVEDNPQDAELLVRALKRRNHADHIFIVEDGAEALDFIFANGKFSERAQAEAPKVVFLDLKLPKVNGLEVLRTLKQNPQTHSIPVVVVTSSLEECDIKTAYELGVNSYVVKPVEFMAFQETMGHLGLYWLSINQCSK
jgi:two-component system response regulator